MVAWVEWKPEAMPQATVTKKSGKKLGLRPFQLERLSSSRGSFFRKM